VDAATEGCMERRWAEVERFLDRYVPEWRRVEDEGPTATTERIGTATRTKLTRLANIGGFEVETLAWLDYPTTEVETIAWSDWATTGPPDGWLRIGRTVIVKSRHW